MHVIIATETDLSTIATFYLRFFEARLLVSEHNYLELASGILQGTLSFYDVSSYRANINGEFDIPVPSSESSVSHCEVYINLGDHFEALYQMFSGSTNFMLADKCHKDWGDEVFYVRDPSGLILALARKISV